MLDKIWSLLVKINQICRTRKNLKFISILTNKTSFQTSIDKLIDPTFMLISLDNAIDAQSEIQIVCYKPFHFKLILNQALSQPELLFLQTYLPYAVLPYFAQQENKIFTISHFAQTLDGKIASTSGDSKWIGNEENLKHAHRMRALCDAVVVGYRTNEIDKPKLTVRKVEGNNPLRVVVGRDFKVLDYVNTERLSIDSNSCYKDAEQSFQLKLSNIEAIFRTLEQKNIKTIYLEGGSFTTSNFIRQGKIDQVQIHISAKILGSGLSGYSFEGIESVKDCIKFKNHRFIPIGDEIMFIGNL